MYEDQDNLPNNVKRKAFSEEGLNKVDAAPDGNRSTTGAEYLPESGSRDAVHGVQDATVPPRGYQRHDRRDFSRDNQRTSRASRPYARNQDSYGNRSADYDGNTRGNYRAGYNNRQVDRQGDNQYRGQGQRRNYRQYDNRQYDNQGDRSDRGGYRSNHQHGNDYQRGNGNRDGGYQRNHQDNSYRDNNHHGGRQYARQQRDGDNSRHSNGYGHDKGYARNYRTEHSRDGYERDHNRGHNDDGRYKRGFQSRGGEGYRSSDRHEDRRYGGRTYENRSDQQRPYGARRPVRPGYGYGAKRRYNDESGGYKPRGYNGHRNNQDNSRDNSRNAHSQMIRNLATSHDQTTPPEKFASSDSNQNRTFPVSRLLAEITGLGSRRKIGEMLENGRMTVNGNTMNAGDHILRTDIKEVILDGSNIPIACNPEEEPALRVLMYHKGINELCSRFDMRGRKLIFRNLPQVHGRWISVGRLDYMTSGLLLCTNNGELAQRLMHPSFEVPREYRVRVAGKLDDGMVDVLLKGVDIGADISKFDQIKVANEITSSDTDGINTTIDVVLHTGRNREVRKLLEEVGLHVIRLRRTRFGEFRLPEDSTPGNTHELSIEEKNLLLKSVGMEPTIK